MPRREQTGRNGDGARARGPRRFVLPGLVALIAVALAALAGTAGAAEPGLDPSATSAIDRFVEEQMDARRVPGVAVAVVRDGEVVYQRGFGTADGDGRAVEPDTPFVLGSVTKSFTALAVMQLVDAGTVSLDDPVSRWIPELRLGDGDEARVTVRHLLTQTSGIPALAGGRLLRSVGDGTLEDAVRELDGTDLAAAPGARFEYANGNYVLLGLIVERASGEPYGDYVQRHVFDPLGMRSSFASPEAARAAGLAVGHRFWFGLRAEHGPTSSEAVRPSGYLMSSAADMARYLAMYLGGGQLDGARVISEEALATMLAPVGSGHLGPWADGQETRYAMGWFVGGPWDEQALLHPGRAPDSSAMIVLLPEQELAVVTLMNASHELPLPGGAGELQRIPRGVVDLLLGEEPDAGGSLVRFYIVFDAVVVLALAAIGAAAVRLVRRRYEVPAGGRRALGVARAVAELLVGVLLLAGPALTGQGYAGALLWWPDLAVVLLVVGALMVLLGVVRLLLLLWPRSRAAYQVEIWPATTNEPEGTPSRSSAIRVTS